MNETSTAASATGSGTSAAVSERALSFSRTTTRGSDAQLRVELAPSDVDRVDARRSPLEQAVGEASGRGPDVETDPAARVEGEVVEGRRELDASARHVGMLGTGDADRDGLVEGLPGFLRPPPVHLDEPREDEGLRLRPRRREAPRDQQRVEPRLQSANTTFIDPSARRARAEGFRRLREREAVRDEVGHRDAAARDRRERLARVFGAARVGRNHGDLPEVQAVQVRGPGLSGRGHREDEERPARRDGADGVADHGGLARADEHEVEPAAVGQPARPVAERLPADVQDFAGPAAARGRETGGDEVRPGDRRRPGGARQPQSELSRRAEADDEESTFRTRIGHAGTP